MQHGAIHKRSSVPVLSSVTLTNAGCKTIFDDEDGLKSEALAVVERIVIELLVK
jgi:hypothetical protein